MRREAVAGGLLVVAIAAVAWLSLRGKESPADGAGKRAHTATGCWKGSPPGAEDEDPRAASSAPLRAPEKTLHDPAARRATREALVAKLGAKYPKPKASADTSRPPPEPPPSDGAPRIDPQYIRERVREDFFPLARDCYDLILKHNPKAAGKVSLHFTIVGDESVGGIVETANVGDESTLRDDEFDTCMEESMMAMTFPPPKGGGVVTVEYPIEFAPGDDDDDGGHDD